LHDPDPQVRREIAIALQDVRTEPALESLIELCRQYDGKDRWYLEALGIAARGRENALFARMLGDPDKWDSRQGKLWWEFRPSDARPYLTASLRSQAFSIAERVEALDALTAMAAPEAGRTVAEIISSDATPADLAAHAFSNLSQRLFSEWVELRKDPAVVAAVKKSMLNPRTQAKAIELVDDLEDAEYAPELLAIVKSSAAAEDSRAAAIQALGRTRDQKYVPELQSLLRIGPVRLRVSARPGDRLCQTHRARVRVSSSSSSVRPRMKSAPRRSGAGPLGSRDDSAARSRAVRQTPPLSCATRLRASSTAAVIRLSKREQKNFCRPSPARTSSRCPRFESCWPLRETRAAESWYSLPPRDQNATPATSSAKGRSRPGRTSPQLEANWARKLCSIRF
jgi:hypothetical protein